MERLKIAAVQMNALKDDLDHNIEKHIHFIEETAKAGCGLVMFPELSVTTHFRRDEQRAAGIPTQRSY